MNMDSLSAWFSPEKKGGGCNAEIDVGKTIMNLNSALPIPDKGEAPHDLVLHAAIIQQFPGALPATAFVAHATALLKEKGLNGDNTLLATSFCAGED